MDMQDKDFDRLFSSKLNDLEMEPSKAVWQGIDEELGGKRRKAIIPFLRIAASIIVLITAGVVFYPKHITTVVKPKVQGRVARIQPLKTTSVATSGVKDQPLVQAPKAVLASVKGAVHQKPIINNVVNTPVQKQVIIAKNDAPVNAPALQILANNTLHDVIKQKATVVDSTKAIASVPVIRQVERPILTAAINSTPVAKPSDTTPVKKHRIHSFGDILNVAIAAVDKRKDKAIKFQDGDDD